MKIFRDINEIKGKIRNPVVTIGNFDGVHKGHQHIFKIIKEKARKINGETVVMTFDPHPVKVLSGEDKIFLLTPTKKKLKLIEKFGIENVLLIKFTKEFANLEPEEFIKILTEYVGVRELYVGFNYFFGKNKKGNVNLLREYGKIYNFNVHILEPFIVDGITVSSTLCREYIAEGKVKEVLKFLGRYYLIEGKVVEGKHRGHKIGIPTANIKSEQEVYPKEGVYAVKVAYRGKIYDGACSIGFNPTFESDRLTVEVHILNFNKDIYNETLKVVFIDRIRPMIKFKSIEELKATILEDIEKAKKILKPIKISLKNPDFV